MDFKQFQNKLETVLEDAFKDFPNWKYLTKKDILLLLILGIVMWIGD